MEANNITITTGKKAIDINVSKNIGTNYDIPIDSPTTGDAGLRDDIKVKQGLFRGTYLVINKTKDVKVCSFSEQMLFSKEFSGSCLTQSITIETSGGEISAPYVNTSLAIVGVSDG